MKAGVEVTGLSDLQAQLENLSANLAAKTLARAALKAFKPVLESAKALVPVDTGLLRDSIRVKVVKPENPNATAVAVGLRIARGKGARASEVKGLRGSARKAAWRKSASWRWHFVELGTSSQAARPFLRPALNGNAHQVISLLRTELAAEISRAVKAKRKAKR